MKNILLLLPLVLMACNNSPEKPLDEDQETSEATMEVSAEEEEVPELTVDERILEIKKFYTAIQKSDKTEEKCISKTKMTSDGFSEEMEFPFENLAMECTLKGGFMYQSVELNGYEWGETCTFYYKDDALFFAFERGGAEACSYEYRVYYNKAGDVIRVLSAENDCDGDEPPGSQEVTDTDKKDEILKSVAYAKKELMDILEH